MTTCFCNYLCYLTSTQNRHTCNSPKTASTKHKFNFTIHSYHTNQLFGVMTDYFPNTILFNIMKVTLHITWFDFCLEQFDYHFDLYGKAKKKVIFFSLLWGFQLFPLSNNIRERFRQFSLHIYRFFFAFVYLFLAVVVPFIPFYSCPLRSLNQQSILLSPLLNLCFSLDSHHIHWSPDSQHHLATTQDSTIQLSMNKVTVHPISKGIPWPVSVMHCFKKSSSLSPQSCQNIQLQRREF